MILMAVSLAVVFVANATLGILVLAANPARRPNQQFFGFALVLSLWSLLMFLIVNAKSAAAAEFLIRLASYETTVGAVSFHLLCMSIGEPTASTRFLLKRARWRFVLSQIVGVMCFTGFYISAVEMRVVPGMAVAQPNPVYGPGFLIQAVYFLLTMGSSVRYAAHRMRSASGLARLEYGFVLLGTGLTVLVAIVNNALVPIITGSTVVQQFGPLTAVVANIVIAYGIATRRILEVRQVVRGGAAYALLAVYLGLLYLCVWFPLSKLTGRYAPGADVAAHLLATVVLVVSVAPAHGLMQRFANSLFINLPSTDVGRTADRVGAILQSIGSMADLLPHFSDAVAREVGTDRVRILLREDGGFREIRGPGAREAALILAEDDPVVAAVAASRQPLVRETVGRRPTDERVLAAAGRMGQLGVSAALGVRTKDNLAGILLLGPRLSARVYGEAEQRALQVAADRLAAAVENLRLYSQLQNSKMYSDILVDRLVSGVVATDAGLRITVFNAEAQRVTGLATADAVRRPVDVLPEPLGAQLRQVIEQGEGVRDMELTISRRDGESVPVQVGSALLRGHEGDVLGALVVFTDLSVVRRLETQVRRSAHLASLGTLSAGMAHEIRNPLQTVKTFCQLLPERYGDAEFRQKFSALVEREVDRIDTIVTQLLQFGRPAKAQLSAVSAHGVLTVSLHLVEARAHRRGVAIEKRFEAARDVVMGDANLLEQAFVNLLINGLDAMRDGGRLSVATRLRPALEDADGGRGGGKGERPPDRHGPGGAAARPPVSGDCIEVTVADTGAGIEPADIPHIFDPFFTTKATGVGLGLSVAHGIVADHRGSIEVESRAGTSRAGTGTSFRVLLPLCDAAPPQPAA